MEQTKEMVNALKQGIHFAAELVVEYREGLRDYDRDLTMLEGMIATERETAADEIIDMLLHVEDNYEELMEGVEDDAEEDESGELAQQ